MSVPLVGATAVWVGMGLWLVRRRGVLRGWYAAVAAGGALGLTAMALEARGVAGAMATGGIFGIGAIVWREAGDGRDVLWLLPLGVLGGVSLNAGGWGWALGAGAGVLGALGLASAGTFAAVASGLGVVRRRPVTRHVLVCWGPACQRHGARALRRSLTETGRRRKGLRITPVSCLGRCAAAPVVWVEPEGTLWTHVEPGEHPEVLGEARQCPSGG